MRVRWRNPALLSLAFGLILGACATTAPPAPPAPVAAPPAPPAPSAPPRASLADRHHQQAQALERDGFLRRALEEWQIALTIDPDDAGAREAAKALQGRIEQAVTQRIEEGRRALARGVNLEARRRFLSALALDPNNRVAFEALQSQARDVAFIPHTVRQGDTLQALALRYYGDRSRSEVIWETNQLPPNPRLTAGTTLKIPEIPGVPFVHEARRPAPPAADVARAVPGKGEQPDDYREVNPLLAEAREAFEKNEYSQALSDLDRVLSANPRDRDGIALKKAVLYQQGKTQMQQRRYADSYQTLTQLAKLQPDYEDLASLLKQARARTIEQHYAEGVRLYREERLPEAIAEWRIVLDVDPQHANARKNIEQAERLLKGLEQRMKK